MKIDEIKTIVKLMSDNDLTEFKIESEEMTLCLRRAARQQAAPAPVFVPAAVTAPAPAQRHRSRAAEAKSFLILCQCSSRQP